MTTPPINHDQATKLAAFIHTLRPEWDKPGILDAIGRARDRGAPAEVAVAAIRCAVSGQARTPAVIGMDGPHWREPERKHTGPATLVTGRCRDCGHLHPPADPCAPPREQSQQATAASAPEARALIVKAKAGLCTHGVAPGLCAEHDPRRQPEEAP